MDYASVQHVRQLPLEEKDRKPTDVICIIIGGLFTLILLIFSIIIFKQDNYNRASFPSDSSGKVCGYDYPTYGFIYFANYPQTNRRVCVQNCPKQNDVGLNCMPTQTIGCKFNNNSQFVVSFYQNLAESTDIGQFCVPVDPIQKEQLFQNINVSARYNFFSQMNSILISALIAVGLSSLFLLSVQYFPRKMNLLTIYGGLLVIFIAAIWILFSTSTYLIPRIIFSILLFLLFAMISIGCWKNKANLTYHAVFLEFSTKFTSQKKKIFFYIPIFMVILVLFALIVLYELRSFWSSGAGVFDENSLYYTFDGSTSFKNILLAIQIIWGLSFIKESFNFCLSGNAVAWYFQEAKPYLADFRMFYPVKTLVTKHLGSVIAASFLSGFFTFGDYVFDTLRPNDYKIGTRCYDKFYRTCLEFVGDFFNLVRSDSLAYMNLTGNPYCNSSRYCQHLSDQSQMTENAQSMSRSYRICAHFLISGIISIINLQIQGSATSLYVTLFVFVQSLFISTMFISTHADASEAFQIIFLVDEELERRDQIQNNVYDASLGRQILNNVKLRKSLAEEIIKIHTK